jgi:hypothetical protein
VTWLLEAMGGLMVSAVLLVFGLRVGDRWLAVGAGVAAVAFVGAVAVFAREL